MIFDFDNLQNFSQLRFYHMTFLFTAPDIDKWNVSTHKRIFDILYASDNNHFADN